MSKRDIEMEQAYLDMLYRRLDGLREQAADRLADVLRQPAGGTHQSRHERDVHSRMHVESIARLDAGENRLCFGRLDFHDEERRYIGRLGLRAEKDDYEPLLIDWRAPAARPYYLATAASPEGVRRRRHIRTQGRIVTGVDDEVLDLADADVGRQSGLTGEAALLAALDASRTGRMRDVVETIQAEQDRVIRSDHRGILVVQGGPGTGKTAVALHRAAYLLYTYRDQLAKRGVLIVGPNTTFLRYIEQVLPALGETGVLLSTVGDLFPGVRARLAEPPETAALKGRLSMARVIEAAVRDRQELPDEPLRIEGEHYEVVLDAALVERARHTARETRLPHNEAKRVFLRAAVAALAQQVADRLNVDPFAEETGNDEALLDADDIAEIREELRGDDVILAALDRLWPTLTPHRLLADLFAGPDRLARAAPDLPERLLLVRPEAAGWTPADVPLLDEAAELLGEDDRALLVRAEWLRRQRVDQAQGVLDIMSGSQAHEMDDLDIFGEHEALLLTDLIDAERLAERQEELDSLTVAERAAVDRRWTFGHVIVDEAQELSEMAWRMLMRRCPNRSMTLVGDVAQTGDLAGTSSWQRVLAPYVAERWRLTHLTINYRTPAEIMDVASALLARFDPSIEAPRSVRSTGVEPWRSTEDLATLVAQEREAVGEGRVAVLVPASRLDALRTLAADDPESPVVVLTVRQAKGLEFDSVLVVDPDRILDESPRGANDLYVALTRTTRRLGIVHPAAGTPKVLGELSIRRGTSVAPSRPGGPTV